MARNKGKDRTIGDNVIYHREKLGLSQSDLASRLHVTRACISYIENSKRIPSLVLVLNLMTVLSISIDQLVANVALKGRVYATKKTVTMNVYEVKE